MQLHSGPAYLIKIQQVAFATFYEVYITSAGIHSSRPSLLVHLLALLPGAIVGTYAKHIDCYTCGLLDIEL